MSENKQPSAVSLYKWDEQYKASFSIKQTKARKSQERLKCDMFSFEDWNKDGVFNEMTKNIQIVKVQKAHYTITKNLNLLLLIYGWGNRNQSSKTVRPEDAVIEY